MSLIGDIESGKKSILQLGASKDSAIRQCDKEVLLQ